MFSNIIIWIPDFRASFLKKLSAIKSDTISLLFTLDRSFRDNNGESSITKPLCKKLLDVQYSKSEITIAAANIALCPFPFDILNLLSSLISSVFSLNSQILYDG